MGPIHSPLMASTPPTQDQLSIRSIGYCNTINDGLASPQQKSRTTSTTMLDTCILVRHFDEQKMEVREQPVYAHRLILNKSPYFCNQLTLLDQKQELVKETSNTTSFPLFGGRRRGQPQPIPLLAAATVLFVGSEEAAEQAQQTTTLQLDLSIVRDAVQSFKVLLNFLYGGQLNIAEANPETLIFLAKLCELPELEAEITSQLTAMAQNSARTNLFNKMVQQHMESTLANEKRNDQSSSPTTNVFSPSVYAAYLQLQSMIQGQASIEATGNGFHLQSPFNSNQFFNQSPMEQPSGNNIIGSIQKAMATAVLGTVANGQQQDQTSSLFNQQQLSNRSSLSSERSGSQHSGTASSSPTLQYMSANQQKPGSIFLSTVPMPNKGTDNQMVDQLETRGSPLNAVIGRFHLPLTNTDSTGSTGSGNSVATAASGGELLVPSNDKEGWCRNKKYIQIVKKGYRCIVCNKVYGRYNSVSYHVTIYHRNPPIKCEEDGCQFTTREARYIHFHKYYRHQIPLPESIDLASRKCPLNKCKHVSKSPAMLDKHIHRHVTDCLKDGVYKCSSDCLPTSQSSSIESTLSASPLSPNCEFSCLSHEEMFEHLRTVHSEGGISSPLLLTPSTPTEPLGIELVLMSPKSEDMSGVLNGQTPPDPVHSLSLNSVSGKGGLPGLNSCGGVKKHTGSTSTSASFRCELCNYRGRTLLNLEQHKVFKHSNEMFNLGNNYSGGKRLSNASSSSSEMKNLNHFNDFMDVEETSPMATNAMNANDIVMKEADQFNSIQTAAALTNLFNNRHLFQSALFNQSAQQGLTGNGLNLAFSGINSQVMPNILQQQQQHQFNGVWQMLLASAQKVGGLNGQAPPN